MLSSERYCPQEQIGHPASFEFDNGKQSAISTKYSSREMLLLRYI